MSAYEPYVDHAIGVADPNDQSLLISREIENHTRLFEYVGISEIPLVGILTLSGDSALSKLGMVSENESVA